MFEQTAISVQKFPPSPPVSGRPRLEPTGISVQKLPESPPGWPPYLPLCGSSGCCTDDYAHNAALVALSSWNEKSIANNGPEYELVEVKGGRYLSCPVVIHCNFVARPRNNSIAEPKLFFGEAKYPPPGDEDDIGDGICTSCYMLGPIGYKSGPVKCRICAWERHLIQHPENGDFIKGRERPLFKANAGKRKRDQELISEP